MRISVEINGRVVDTEVDGTPIIPTDGLFDVLPVEESNRLRLCYRAPLSTDLADGRPTKLCGFLPVPYLSHTGEESLATLWIPAPSPFHDQELRDMWARINEYEFARLGSLPLQGELATNTALQLGYEGRSDSALLAQLARAARQLLWDWPTKTAADQAWRPIALPGGVEDLPSTLRRGWRARAIRTRTGEALPMLSTRRRLTTAPWQIAYVASLAARVTDVLQRKYAPSQLIQRMQSVARFSAQPSSVADPPASSWPPALMHFSRLAWQFLEMTRTSGDNDYGPLPTCEVWRLYEAWVGSEILAHLCELLGPPTAKIAGTPDQSGWTARWIRDRVTVHFESQCRFRAQLEQPTSTWKSHFCSVTADLTPDFVLSVEGPQSPPSLLILDAKERGIDFQRDHAAAEAAKFLWGLRKHDGSEATSLRTVVLATSRAVEEQPFNPDFARMAFVQTRLSDCSQLHRAVTDFLRSEGVLSEEC